MGNFWLKLKAWTKVTILIVLVVLVGIFVVLNLSAVIEPQLHLIFVKYDRPNLLVVLVMTSLLSIVGWSLGGAVLRTIRQVRELRHRSTQEKLVRDVEQMKAKAARLQTRPESAPAPEEPQ